MNDQPAGALGGRGSPEHRLVLAGARHVDRRGDPPGRELAGHGREDLDVLAGLQAAGVDTLDGPGGGPAGEEPLDHGGLLGARGSRGHGDLFHDVGRPGKLVHIRPNGADVPGRVGRGGRKRGLGVGGRRGGEGVGSGHEGLAAAGHVAQEQRGQESPQQPGAGQDPFERLGPEVLDVEDEGGVQLAGEPQPCLGALEGREAGEDDVGAVELPRRDAFVGQPFERAAEVFVAVQPGQRDVFVIRPRGHQPHGEPLVLADPERGGADGLAAVAPGGGPPGHIVAPGHEHPGQRPVAERRDPFAGDVVEGVDQPDGERPGGERVGRGAGHDWSLAKRRRRAEPPAPRPGGARVWQPQGVEW